MYTDGQIISKEQYTSAAMWCNKNKHYICNVDGQYIIRKVQGPSLDELKLSKIEQLKETRNSKEQAPVEYKEKLWDFDSKARDRIVAASTALEVSTDIASISWTAFDDTSLDLTVTDLKMIIATAALRGDTLHKQYRQLRDAVNAAETAEEIEAINWE